MRPELQPDAIRPETWRESLPWCDKKENTRIVRGPRLKEIKSGQDMSPINERKHTTQLYL